MMVKKKVVIFCLFFLLCPCFCLCKTLHINIHGPGEKKINVFVSSLMDLNENKKECPIYLKFFRETLIKNFSFLPFVNLISSAEILGGSEIKGFSRDKIDFNKFYLSKVDMLILVGWKEEENRTFVEIKGYDVFNQMLFIGKRYEIEPVLIYNVANRFCASFLEKLVGIKGFFDSYLALIVKKDNFRDIYVCTPQGYNWQRITRTDGLCLSPAWSWDNRYIAFTLIKNQSSQLWVYDVEKNSFKQIPVPGNTVISPAFTPDGYLSVSLDFYGNPDIYLLRGNKIVKELVKGWGIDISPSFDRKGKKMAFVSSRLGSPQIFILDLDSKKISRISYEGNYNTDPAISPDGRYVVYSRLTDSGHRLILHDLNTGEEKQISFGPGNDEHPTWGPDGFFIAFTSNRSGRYKVYITTRLGTKAIPIKQDVEGDIISPSWSK